MKAISAVLSVAGAVSGVFLAYLVATAEAGGPIYSGWMTLFLVLAAGVCGLAALGGLLIFFEPRASIALMLAAVPSYATLLFLMTRRYEADPVSATFITAGPVAGLFLVAAVLAVLVQRHARGEG